MRNNLYFTTLPILLFSFMASTLTPTGMQFSSGGGGCIAGGGCWLTIPEPVETCESYTEESFTITRTLNLKNPFDIPKIVLVGLANELTNKFSKFKNEHHCKDDCEENEYMDVKGGIANLYPSERSREGDCEKTPSKTEKIMGIGVGITCIGAMLDLEKSIKWRLESHFEDLCPSDCALKLKGSPEFFGVSMDFFRIPPRCVASGSGDVTASCVSAEKNSNGEIEYKMTSTGNFVHECKLPEE